MIQISNIEKKYKKKEVLRGLSAEFQNGITCILGPNGAGKTTMLRILAGIEERDNGQVTYLDQNKQIKHEKDWKIGYLPQTFGLIKEYTLEEHMRYFALLKEIPKEAIEYEVDRVLKLLNLYGEKKTKCRKLSGGMVRRAGIAQTILGSPDFILLDEPTTGLDPEERIRFHKVIKEISSNCIVLLSTHIIEDVDNLDSNVVVMNRGKFIYRGTNKGLEDLGITNGGKESKDGYMALINNEVDA